MICTLSNVFRMRYVPDRQQSLPRFPAYSTPPYEPPATDTAGVDK